MIDRRLGVVAVLVAVGVFALHGALTGAPDSVAESSTTDRAIALDPPAEATVGTPSSALDSVDDQPPITTRIPEPAASARVPVLVTVPDAVPAIPSPVLEVEMLVESRRPAIDEVQVRQDHDHDDGEFAASGSQGAAPIEQVAAGLVVAGWTWRFDDAANRQVDAITALATGDAIEMLIPSTDELARRADAGEVSWVIVRDIRVDGSGATVTFDQHVVTSSLAGSTAETVTSRTVVVDVVVGVAVAVSF
jgi:hypothetical protein